MNDLEYLIKIIKESIFMGIAVGIVILLIILAISYLI